MTQHTETATPKRYVMVSGTLTEAFNPSIGNSADQWMQCSDHERIVAVLQAKIDQMEDEWYSPGHMDALQKRTIEPLRTQLAQAQDEATELKRQKGILIDRLKTILPMAKEYAAENVVGGISVFVRNAETSIEIFEGSSPNSADSQV